jgi:Ser/Thr protein kinase RdoA (MazF antagonist)
VSVDDRVPAELQDVLRQACDQTGLDPVGARLIKLTNNAVFSLAHDPYVVRIAASDLVGRQAGTTILFARWLAAHDVPTIRPWEPVDQPLQVRGHAVTIWHRVESTGRPTTMQQLADILRRLHDSTEPVPGLPEWDMISELRRRLNGQDVLTEEQSAFLSEQVDELAEAITRVDYLLPAGPIHGDAHDSSLIPGPEGVVICDFDTAAYGPRECDLMPVAVNSARFAGFEADQDEIAAAYGLDVREWEHYPVMRRIRELQVMTAVLPILRIDPGVRAQWLLRYDSVRAGDTEAVWTPWDSVDIAATSIS